MKHSRTWRGLAVATAAALALGIAPSLAGASDDVAIEAGQTSTATHDPAAPVASTPSESDFSALAAGSTSDAVWDFFRVVNTDRVNHGLDPLTQRGSLNAIANSWAGQQAGKTYPVLDPNFGDNIPGAWTWGVQASYVVTADSPGSAIEKLTPKITAGDWRDGTIVDMGVALVESSYYSTKLYTLYAFGIDLPHSTAAANELTMWRFYRPDTGTHFYTTTASERNQVATNPGYRYEGQVAYVLNPSVTTANTSALNRFYTPSTWTHFYTASPTEYARVLTFPQYTLDGVAAKVYSAQVSGTVPMYRFFRPSSGTHFYSANPTEVAAVKQMPGYTYEGVAYYLRTAS